MGIGFLVPIIYLASAGVLFLTAGIILKENAKSSSNRVVAAMLSFAGMAPLFAALYRTVFAETAELSQSVQNIFYVWELFFPALLLFSVVFPNTLPIYKKHKRIIQFAFVPHIFHLLLVVFLNDPDKIFGLLDFNTSTPILGQVLGFVASLLKIATAIMGFLLLFHSKFFSLINFAYVILAVYFLNQGYKNVTNPTLKTQVKIIIWGITSAVGLYVAAYIIPAILSLRFPAGLREIMILISLIVGPGTIAWAIIKFRFMDIGLIARQSLVYTVTTAIVVGGYLLVISELSTLFASTLGVQSRFLDIIVVIILLLFFQPLYNQIDEFVRRIFIKSRSDYRHFMEEFSKQLVTAFDLDRLATIIQENLNREMFIEKAYLAVSQKGASTYRIIGDTAAFPLEAGVLASLVQKQRPIYTKEIEGLFDYNNLGGRLNATGGFLLVPLIDKNELVGIISLSQKTVGFRYTYEDITVLNVVANQVIVSINNAQLYAESLEKQLLEEELELARKIQLNLLPQNLPVHDKYEFAAFNHPSRQVGGDYYDFIKLLNGSIGVVIADVSGKGVPAALLMARVQAILQTQEKRGLPIPELLSQLNEFIVNSSSSDKFVTMFYCEIDLNTGHLRFCNAGHNYPFVVKTTGEVYFLEEGGLILGAFSGSAYQTADIKLGPGEILVMYTDGISEAMNLEEKEFGDSRVVALTQETRTQSAHYICGNMIKSVRQYSSGSEEIDDMTMVVIKAK